VQRAVSARAEIAFAMLSPLAREKLDALFSRLVDVDDEAVATRRRVPLSAIVRDDDWQEVVNVLTAHRLLVTALEDDEPTAELAHDTLFRSWARLAEWLALHQEDLLILHHFRTAAREWARSARQNAYRWPEERLRAMRAVLGRLRMTATEDLDPVEQLFFESETQGLIAELAMLETSYVRWSEIGERLSILGDPRQGVGVTGDGAPEIGWAQIPVHGSAAGGASLAVSTYPVTFMQFQAFLEAPDGYCDDRWWWSLSAPRSVRKDAGLQRFKWANNPRDTVSWFEAMAFCGWVSHRLHRRIRLLTEEEWRFAAVGAGQCSYTWGEEWIEGHANTSESGLARTTAVGMYPHGITSSGILDMCGNVLEWCLNKYEDPSDRAEDGVYDRAVCGGAFDLSRVFARVAYRMGRSPQFRSRNLGFRVCTNDGA